MGKIENYLSFVKEQVSVQEKLAKKYEEDYRRAMHIKTANGFAELARFLEEIQKKGTEHLGYMNRGNAPQKRLFLTFEEIENAPEELLRELNISETDRQELLIEYIIADHEGVFSLDKIMMELYNKTKEVPKRSTVTSRLYRMVGRGMIYNVPGKKGVYSTYELSEPEAKKMFGQFDESAEESTSPATATTTSASAARSATTPSSASAQPQAARTLKERFLAGVAPPSLPAKP